ncbi:MAG TPA: hypothetical protein VGB17_17325 [Pyrinomonadaceae bacterium]|jgi:hypothetical protein
MIKNGLRAMLGAARMLLTKKGALALFNLLYAVLLALLYLFISTKEATRWQLVLTALLALLVPLLFFILQAAGVHFALSEGGFRALLRRALRDFWKLVLISLPLIALAVLVLYLLNKLQVRFPVPEPRELPRPALTPIQSPASPPVMPMHWPSVLFSSLRLLLVGIILPLLAIQLWIAVARDGFLGGIKKSLSALGRALSPQSVFIYTVGLLLFGLMPYFLIFTRTPIKNGWAELFIFGLRLALAFVLTLWGWIITLGALAKVSNASETTPVALVQSEPAQTPEAQAQI